MNVARQFAVGIPVRVDPAIGVCVTKKSSLKTLYSVENDIRNSSIRDESRPRSASIRSDSIESSLDYLNIIFLVSSPETNGTPNRSENPSWARMFWATVGLTVFCSTFPRHRIFPPIGTTVIINSDILSSLGLERRIVVGQRLLSYNDGRAQSFVGALSM